MYDYRPKKHKTRKHRELEQYIRYELLDFQENKEEHLYDLEEDLYETLCSSCTSIALPYYLLNLDVIFDANRTKRQKATSSRKSKNDHGYCSPDNHAIYQGTKEQVYRQTPQIVVGSVKQPFMDSKYETFQKLLDLDNE